MNDETYPEPTMPTLGLVFELDIFKGDDKR